MKVCIVGAGNIGLGLAGVASLLGNEVTIYTQHGISPNKYVLYDAERKREYTGLAFRVCPDLATAVSQQDYILCTYPAFLRQDFIEKSIPFISPGSAIGFVPGYGGAEYMCSALLAKKVTVFGLQRVPFVARQESRTVASIVSRKKKIYVAAIPAMESNRVCRDMEKVMGIEAECLDEYLSVTLSPSNPLLHLTGLYNVFKDYEQGDYYDSRMMFYDEWNDDASSLLFQYDYELQEICRLIPSDLSGVISLKEYYESPTPHDMTKKLKSIDAFKVVEVPLVCEKGCYYPDWGSRMFIEDFPFGLAILKYFALLTGTETPAMDVLLDFYREKTGKCYFELGGGLGKDFAETGVLAKYGLRTLSEILAFYRQGQ